MNEQKREEILRASGWTIECVLPFEIRHEDGSFATNTAARLVEADLVASYRANHEPDFKARAIHIVVGGLVEPYKSEALQYRRNLGLIDEIEAALKESFVQGKNWE
jgi:hypothetical protein